RRGGRSGRGRLRGAAHHAVRVLPRGHSLCGRGGVRRVGGGRAGRALRVPVGARPRDPRPRAGPQTGRDGDRGPGGPRRRPPRGGVPTHAPLTRALTARPSPRTHRAAGPDTESWSP